MATQDVFDDSNKQDLLVDASQNGCTGMFWREAPSGRTSMAPDWPRNGTKLKGWVSTEHPGWVRIDHPENYWLPMEQHGKPVVHLQK